MVSEEYAKLSFLIECVFFVQKLLFQKMCVFDMVCGWFVTSLAIRFTNINGGRVGFPPYFVRTV